MLSRDDLKKLFKFCFCLTRSEKSAYALLFYFFKNEAKLLVGSSVNQQKDWYRVIFKQFIVNYREGNNDVPEEISQQTPPGLVNLDDLHRLPINNEKFGVFFERLPTHAQALLFLVGFENCDEESVHSILDVNFQEVAFIVQFIKNRTDHPGVLAARNTLKPSISIILDEVMLPVDKEQKLLKLLIDLKPNQPNLKSINVFSSPVKRNLELVDDQDANVVTYAARPKPVAKQAEPAISHEKRKSVKKQPVKQQSVKQRAAGDVLYAQSTQAIASSFNKAQPKTTEKRVRKISNALKDIELSIEDFTDGFALPANENVGSFSLEDREQYEKKHTWVNAIGFFVIVVSVGLLAFSQFS